MSLTAVHINILQEVNQRMAKVELKQPIIDEIKAQLDGAKSVVVVDYRGISVADVTELRKQCREANIVYKVFKNTMVKRAVEGTEFEGITKDLDGTNAFAISKEDATAPARVLAAFSKKAKVLELKSGVVEGTYYDKDGINVIATIPSREELLAKFLGSIQSPIANFARVIKQIAEKDGSAEEAAPAEEAAE
jgi:large subunit ribosomal protein L10